LADLYKQSDGTEDYPGKSIVLKGGAAKLIYELFDQSILPFDVLLITEGQYEYPVFARPLLPYEAPPEQGQMDSRIPAPDYPKPSFTLSCQPSDGLIAVPMP
jgi:hypothetical protein